MLIEDRFGGLLRLVGVLVVLIRFYLQVNRVQQNLEVFIEMSIY